MKRRKIAVTVCCIIALIGGVFIYGAEMPEAARAGTADKAGHVESDAGKKVPDKDKKKEKKQDTQDKAEKAQNIEEKVTPAADQEKRAAVPSTSQSKPSGGNSDNGQKKQGSPAMPSQPAHTHEWEPIREMKDVQEKKAVYGDKCNTCNEDITGYAETHILESNCMGYATDVFIRYDYVTVKKEVVTGYKCDCGARK